MTTFGIFKSNGNSNPAFSWGAKVPLVISSLSHLNVINQGYLGFNKITSASAPLMSANGKLVINGHQINLTLGQSLSDVVSAINANKSINLINVSAEAYSRVEKISLIQSTFGDVFSLRLTSTNALTLIDLQGTDTSVLNDLGLSAGLDGNIIVPAAAFGSAGNFAVNTLADVNGDFKNTIWEKIEISSAGSTIARWFKVGSTDAEIGRAHV